MRPVIFTRAATAELIDAQDWYEAESAGLGRRFRSEIDRTVRRLDDALLVVACFHSSRDPRQWQNRL